jgi:hypothetical protein
MLQRGLLRGVMLVDHVPRAEDVRHSERGYQRSVFAHLFQTVKAAEARRHASEYLPFVRARADRCANSLSSLHAAVGRSKDSVVEPTT